MSFPEGWVPDFLTLLGFGDPKLAPILARVFGYRRLPCGSELLSAMKRCAPPALPEIVWALGRIAYMPAAGPLLDYLTNEDLPVRSAAALALARIGEPMVHDSCLDQAGSESWPLVPLGLVGGRQALRALTDLADKNGSADCLTALGLLGDPGSVPLFLSRSWRNPEARPRLQPRSNVSPAPAFRKRSSSPTRWMKTNCPFRARRVQAGQNARSRRRQTIWIDSHAPVARPR